MRAKLDRWREAWSLQHGQSRPRGEHLRRVGYWALMLALVGVVIWRYLPDYRLDDLGPAPEVAGVSLEGEPVRLGAMRGQVVVLNLWATWCPPCVVETPGFVDLADEFAGDVQFVGLAAERDESAVRAFRDEYEIPYPLVMLGALETPPPENRLLPTTLVIDKRGRVRMRHEGLLLEPALRPILKALAAEGP